jgi:hypothetical protein
MPGPFSCPALPVDRSVRQSLIGQRYASRAVGAQRTLQTRLPGTAPPLWHPRQFELTNRRLQPTPAMQSALGQRDGRANAPNG